MAVLSGITLDFLEFTGAGLASSKNWNTHVSGSTRVNDAIIYVYLNLFYSNNLGYWRAADAVLFQD